MMYEEESPHCPFCMALEEQRGEKVSLPRALPGRFGSFPSPVCFFAGVLC